MPATQGFTTVDGALVDNKFAITDDDFKFLYTPPAMGRYVTTNQRLYLTYSEIVNRSGGAAFVGVGTHFAPGDWVAGQLNQILSFTDDTADAQSSAASDFPLETINSNGTGHMIAAVRPFNVIGYNIGTAGASISNAVRLILYSKADGSWGSIGTGVWYVGPITGASAWATGERAICFPLPADFAPMIAAHQPNASLPYPLGKYGVRIQATTAPTTTATSATEITVGRMYQVGEAVADNATWLLSPLQELDMIGAHVAMFVSRDTDTANVTNDAGSTCTALVKVVG